MIRVTELLKFFGLYNDYNFSEEKREFGKYLHRLIERSNSCPVADWDIDDSTYNYYKQYVKFIVDSKIKILNQEYNIKDKFLGLSGTIDIVGEKNNNIYIIDIKSSLSHQPVYQLQTALYYLLLQKNYIEKNQKTGNIKRFCLLLSEKNYKLVPHNKDKEDIQVALSLLNVYNWKLKNKLIKKQKEVELWKR